MLSNLIRIQLTKRPSREDWEYLSLRYLKISGVYDVELHIAVDLFERGVASPAHGGAVLTGPYDALAALDERDV